MNTVEARQGVWCKGEQGPCLTVPGAFRRAQQSGHSARRSTMLVRRPGLRVPQSHDHVQWLEPAADAMFAHEIKRTTSTAPNSTNSGRRTSSRIRRSANELHAECRGPFRLARATTFTMLCAWLRFALVSIAQSSCVPDCRGARQFPRRKAAE